MYSSIQVVFLIDDNVKNVYNKTEGEVYSSKMLLCLLRILTEFGSSTKNGIENVRWSYKFYDSNNYKPDTSKKIFIDFRQSEIEKFSKIIEKKLTGNQQSAASNILRSSNAKKNSPFKTDPGANHSKSFILNKALQEVLQDYNWERHEISSPVKQVKMSTPSGRRKIKTLYPTENEEINFVFLLSNFPNNFSELCEFCHINSASNTSTIACQGFKSIFDSATLAGFHKEKMLKFHIINMSDNYVDRNFKSQFQKELNKICGGFHEIKDLVFSQFDPFVTSETDENSSELNASFITRRDFLSKNFKGIHLDLYKRFFFIKKLVKGRAFQNGPTLVWEDLVGISYLSIPLKILSLHGSAVRRWEQASVCGVSKSSALSFFGFAHSTTYCYLCHSTDDGFEQILSLLQEQNLVLVMKLSCGALGILSPWVQSLGLIVVFSSSSFATPPISMNTLEDPYFKAQHFKEFFGSSIKKILLKLPAVKPLKPDSSSHRFCPQHLKPWFLSSTFKRETFHTIKKKARSRRCNVLFEKLQKKYRPALPLSDTSSAPPLIDVSQIGESAGMSTTPSIDKLECQSDHNTSRAFQIVKKSQIVAAHQKVKEQIEEEKEHLAANEKKKEEAKNRSERYRALAYKALLDTNPQNRQEVMNILIRLRDDPQHEIEEELYTTAQAIINLALMHFKSASTTFSIENEFCDLMRSILSSSLRITSAYEGESLLRQLKLQTLLHFELLWLLGFSNGLNDEGQNLEREKLKETYTEEVLKLLRSLALRFESSTMGDFLQRDVLPNYQDTLGGTLVEIYEELNQPIPEALKAFLPSDDEDVSPQKNLLMEQFTPIKAPKSDPVVMAALNKESTKNSRLLPKREMSNRQIVVPEIKRSARLKRNAGSKDSSSAETKVEDEAKNVRRNLFVKDNPKKESKFRRHNTIASFSTEPFTSPLKNALEKMAAKRSRDELRLEDSTHALSSAIQENNKTPNAKRARVLAPETPANKSTPTIFMQQRLLKSTGVTIIKESPDKAPSCEPSAGIALTRRKSFYSGAGSRNCERAEESMLAQRIKGSAENGNTTPRSKLMTRSSSLFANFL